MSRRISDTLSVRIWKNVSFHETRKDFSARNKKCFNYITLQIWKWTRRKKTNTKKQRTWKNFWNCELLSQTARRTLYRSEYQMFQNFLFILAQQH